MKCRKLQKLFCEKITLELERYKKRMLKQKPEIIMERVYQIDSMINIYESLLEMSQKLSEQALESMLVFPELMALLYAEWLDYEDSQMEELQNCLSQSVKEIAEAYQRDKGKEQDVA